MTSNQKVPWNTGDFTHNMPKIKPIADERPRIVEEAQVIWGY
jgi:hypothetical protein